MTASSELPTCSTVTLEQEQSLLRGEVLISTTAVAQGASVTATMYVPMVRQLTWQKLTDYSQWVQYFPDIVQSQVLEVKRQSKTHPMTRRLYQVARKAFFDVFSPGRNLPSGD